MIFTVGSRSSAHAGPHWLAIVDLPYRGGSIQSWRGETPVTASRNLRPSSIQ